MGTYSVSTEQCCVSPRDLSRLTEESRVPLSAIDYSSPPMFNSWALFFSLKKPQKAFVIDSLQRGLQLTLDQSGWLAGTFQDEGFGTFSIVSHKDSTVQFVVQDLEFSDSGLPSFTELEADHFRIAAPGQKEKLWVHGMEGGSIRLLQPGLPTFGAKLTFFCGGYALVIHTHHSAVDGSGFAYIVRQWAYNTNMIVRDGDSWAHLNPFINDRSVLVHRNPSSANHNKVSAPSIALKAATRVPKLPLLFHLPSSRAIELKRLAQPQDGTFASTYDAFIAIWWRLLVKHRQKIYRPGLSETALFHEAVDMRSRLTGALGVPPAYQGNCWMRGISTSLPAIEQPTLAEVMEKWPLWKLAAVIRKVTNSVSQEDVQRAVDGGVSAEENDAFRLDPMAVGVTDWRSTNICDIDFCFGKPQVFRRLSNGTHGMTIAVYPPQRLGASGGGIDFDLLVESEIVDSLTRDPEVLRWFEFRGARMDINSLAKIRS
ncbi:hypothetical protein GQ53DRAFT_854561 [Thozetella sp. PMI_491]|nr:hypothetical protein GQ53DRAFT_854561 [Thozetella sp. PMI_491]